MYNDEKKAVIYGVLFILLFQIDKRYVSGKRIRKKLLKGINKKLAIYRVKIDNVDKYLWYMYLSSRAIFYCNENMVTSEGTVIQSSIDPASLATLIDGHFDDILIGDILTSKDITLFNKEYENNRLMFKTKVFLNRLKDYIDTVKSFDDATDEEKQECKDYINNL